MGRVGGGVKRGARGREEERAEGGRSGRRAGKGKWEEEEEVEMENKGKGEETADWGIGMGMRLKGREMRGG